MRQELNYISGRRVLVLGGYGLIGSAIVGQLSAAGHSIVALGRSRSAAARSGLNTQWLYADLRNLRDADAWQPFLVDIDVVVNAAGALQDGLDDRVRWVQRDAIIALIEACERRGRVEFVQISAAGADRDGNIEFLRSKREADDRLIGSSLHWTLLRPGLVIGPRGYGGTALLRAIACLPWILPIAFADARVQTVGLGDLSNLVLRAVERRLEDRTIVEAVESRSRTLLEIALALRVWMGLDAEPRVLRVPAAMARGMARIGDALAIFGWRPPMRTTALRVLAAGVTGSQGERRSDRRITLHGLEQTLASMPSGAQSRLEGRRFLLVPVIVATLSAFWLTSGVIAAVNIDAALRQLPLPTATARIVVVTGIVLDLVVGAAILFRPWVVRACLGMIALTGVYLIAGSLLKPGLWLDPLGPFVKPIPAAVLALAGALLFEER